MRKIIDILEAMPVGEVLTNRRVLAVFKRLGYIYDYSQWGYLESVKVRYQSDFGKPGDITYDYVEGVPPHDGILTHDEYCKCATVDFTYKGQRFWTKYLSGCFKPYLYKYSGKTTARVPSVNRSITLWGAIG